MAELPLFGTCTKPAQNLYKIWTWVYFSRFTFLCFILGISQYDWWNQNFYISGKRFLINFRKISIVFQIEPVITQWILIFYFFLGDLNCIPNRNNCPNWQTENFSNLNQLTQLNCILNRTNCPNWPTENWPKDQVLLKRIPHYYFFPGSIQEELYSEYDQLTQLANWEFLKLVQTVPTELYSE